MSDRRNTARLALALVATLVVAACDNSPTAPVTGMRAASAVAGIEGDTLPCRNGWIVVNGRYECLGQ